MARGRSVIVGGGLGTTGALALLAFTYVSQVDPPAVAISPMMAQVTGAQQAVVISSNRADPASTASEVLRVRGGAIIEGTVADTVVIGRGASGVANTVVIGTTSSATVAGTCIRGTLSGGQVAIEGSCTVGGSFSSVAIAGSITGGTGLAVSIGGSVATSANNGRSTTQVGCGGSITSTGTGSTVIGASSSSSADACVVVGVQSDATHAQCILFGVDADSFVANSCMIGGTQTSITLVCTGKGNTSATPAAVTFRLTNATGTDIAGGNYTVQAGLATGAGAPGKVILSVGRKIATSATLQTAYSGLTVDNDGTNAYIIADCLSTDNLRALEMRRAAAQKAIIGLPGTIGGLIAGAAVDSLNFMVNNNTMVWSGDNGVTQHLILSAVGVLTFNVDRGMAFANQTSAAGAAAGTLGNAPAAGNPAFWVKIVVNGTNRSFPVW